MNFQNDFNEWEELEIDKIISEVEKNYYQNNIIKKDQVIIKNNK